MASATWNNLEFVSTYNVPVNFRHADKSQVELPVLDVHAAREAAAAAMVAMSTPSSKPARSLAAVLWPCALYFGCAFAMNMLTKQLLAVHGWSALFTLGAVQNAFTTVSVTALLAAQWLLFGAGPTASSSPRSPSAADKPRARLTYVLRVLVPLVALHVGNMLLGFAAMRTVNMPMYVRLQTAWRERVQWWWRYVLEERRPHTHP